MPKFAVIAVAVAAVLVAAGFFMVRGYAATDESAMPQVGQTAPAFTLPNQEGKPVSLDHYRGEWVVLYFYPRDMTSGCTLEAHNFQRDLAQYKALHAVILGVSVDSVKSHQQFCTKDSLHFTLLSDQKHGVVKEYGSLGHFGPVAIAQRHTFLINPEGKIVKVWPNVDKDIQTHSADVIATIKEMQQKNA